MDISQLYQDFVDWLPHIPTLSESGKRKALRRETTTKFGYYTLLITAIVILLLPLYNHYNHKNTWLQRTNTLIVRKYGFIKRRKDSNSILIINFEVIKIITFWSVIFSILSFACIHSDFQFLAARLGRVATYTLPTILFLTIRPSPLPQTLYLTLLPIHKWLSRMIVVQSLLHTIMFSYLYTIRNNVPKIFKRANIYGIVAMIAFFFIAITSLPYFRRYYYNVFYTMHYLFTWLSVIMLYLHARPGIPYLSVLNCCILLYQVYYRFKLSKVTGIQAINISSNLLLVKLPNNAIKYMSNVPGCHLRMVEYSQGNLFKLLLKLICVPIQHPFTIASLPSDDNQLLIVRKGKFKLSSNEKYLITGSYLPFLKFLSTKKEIGYLNSTAYNPLLFSIKCKKCLIVVGGSSISFALPLLRILSYNGCQVKIIWVIRDHEDLKILDYFKNSLLNDDSIDIFITGNYSNSEKLSFAQAVEELHHRKREFERIEQERMMSNTKYNEDSINEFDFNAISLAETSTPSSSNVSTPLLNTSSKNYGAVKLNRRPKGHRNPMSSPLRNLLNKDSFDSNLDLESGTQYLDHQVELSKHEARQKSSFIQLRSHHQDPHSSYSYNDEKRFENVDIDLNFNPDNDKSSLGDFSVVSSESNESSDPTHNNNTNKKITSSLNTKAEVQGSSQVAHFKPNLGMSSNTYHEDFVKEDSSLNNESYDHFNETLSSFKRPRPPSSSSSALYDDLADYWILKGLSCRIEFGRPKLGLYYYDWCLGSSCIGPLINLSSGQAICYNQISQDNTISMMLNKINQRSKQKTVITSSQYTTEDEDFLNDQFTKNKRERLSRQGGKTDDDVWVIGAGPSKLVDNVRLWAVDCGFSFHAESFSV